MRVKVSETAWMGLTGLSRIKHPVTNGTREWLQPVDVDPDIVDPLASGQPGAPAAGADVSAAVQVRMPVTLASGMHVRH
jgi:hypothetical protein